MSKQFKPSPQQSDFFSWVEKDNGSCVLEAVAGSGKTTTLIHSLGLMKGSIFFGAYNKKIAEEIATKVPKELRNVKVSTMHAAGFGIWGRCQRGLKVDANKCRDIFRKNFDQDNYFLEGSVLSLVSYAKQAGLGILEPATGTAGWERLIDHFNVDTFEEDDKLITIAKKVLQISITLDNSLIDFDDMIYAPLVHKAKATQYDWVLIDESQDTNPSRRALALLMLKRGGRLVAVGDRHQAIYGFTGADSDSMQKIADAVSAKYLPLTVTYRCPQAVVREAQKYVSHINAHESAIEGSVSTVKGSLVKMAKPGDAILSRFNAPIVQMVYQFIAEGIPAKVEGREIGIALKVLARRWKVRSFALLVEKLTAFQEKETTKFRIKEKESQAVAVEDKVKCLMTLINRVMKIDPKTKDPITRLCEEIDNIFADNISNKVVLLSTIHKSKGREWKNVYWLQTGESKWARKDWEIECEKNLKYVAITRAQENLYLSEDY
jgi:superfamily I DNA/RNA helicase